jgi:PAS domain S-box-containing protein
MSTSSATPRSNGPGSLPPSLDQRSHVVQFYRQDRLLIEELARLVGTALVSADSAIVVATEAHRNALASELKSRGLNITKAVAEGRYVALDAQETLAQFVVDHMPDEQRFFEVLGERIAKANAASKSGEARTAIFGEMVALLWTEGKQEAALRLEELWNGLAQKYSFTLRCAYPLSGFRDEEHSEQFAKICEKHSAVYPVGNHTLLLDDDERLRAIAKLQQEVEVLEYQKALLDSEQRFRLLVEAVQDYAIFMLDPEGRVKSWNLGAQRLKGYAASEIIGQHISRFYPEEDIRAAKPQRELEIALREGRVEDEGWRLRKDGSTFWANVVITLLKDPDGNVLGFSKVTRDFTARVQAERALQDSKRKLEDSEKSLRSLSLHLLRTQDEERRRIGRDLHDSLGQYLSVLKMKLDGLQMEASQKQTGGMDDLRQCVQLTEDAVREVRTISYLLYPPMLEEMGLKSAISWYLDGFTKRSGIKTTLEVSPEYGRLSDDVELAFFRVLQESLTNVHRHSGSQTAVVRLTIQDGNVVLEVSDQGKGTQLQNHEQTGEDWMGSVGVGLRGMSERVRQLGGKLNLSSSNKGTTVTATVPMQDSSMASSAS